MCGIAGRLNFDGSPVSPDALTAAIGSLAHRGPDDQGTWIDGPVGLANRRLAVIDLSPLGHQPMTNEDGSVWVVLNGEIYNFLELRQELIAQGHQMRSHSDTEVIVHLYERDGVACVRRLRGMFAIAIWDRRQRRLVLARDPLGKKPLYVSRTDRRLVFGSEPRALFAFPDVPREVAIDALPWYLTYGYVPDPVSAYRGVEKLPPGSTLVVESDGTSEQSRYWQPAFLPKWTDDDETLKRRATALIEQAVSRRLISDVPVGALLSGGVDSGTVVAIASRLSSTRLRTFSVGFDHDAYDEAPVAAAVAAACGTDHEEVRVGGDVADLIPDIAAAYGEPFADSSALPTYFISRVARRAVTVALTGDGGDETFGGYDRYRGLALAGRLDVLPAPIRRVIAAGASRIAAGEPKSRQAKARRFLRALGEPPSTRYASWLSLLDVGDLPNVLTHPGSQAAMRAPYGEAFGAADAGDDFDRAIAADMAFYLPGDLLVKMDIASMANSLETRSPFLDQDVVEFAARLPVRVKARDGQGKWLLRQVARGLLPADVLSRPKMGFAVPLAQWFRGPLLPLASDVLLGRQATERGWIRPAQVRTWLEAHAAGRGQHHQVLWALLMLELWARAALDGPRAGVPHHGA